MKALSLSLAAGLAVLAHVGDAKAQECGGGRVTTPEGYCCWPGQRWHPELRECDGPPRCPRDMTPAGLDCVDADPAARAPDEPVAAPPADTAVDGSARAAPAAEPDTAGRPAPAAAPAGSAATTASTSASTEPLAPGEDHAWRLAGTVPDGARYVSDQKHARIGAVVGGIGMLIGGYLIGSLPAASALPDENPLVYVPLLHVAGVRRTELFILHDGTFQYVQCRDEGVRAAGCEDASPYAAVGTTLEVLGIAVIVAGLLIPKTGFGTEPVVSVVPHAPGADAGLSLRAIW